MEETITRREIIGLNAEEDLRKDVEKLRMEIQVLTNTQKQSANNQGKTSRTMRSRAGILNHSQLEKRGSPLTRKEITERTGLAEATVSGYTLDLYKGGFLDRDRRIVQVQPTRRVRQLEYYIPGKKRRYDTM